MTRDYAKRGTHRKKSKKKSSYFGLWLFVLFLFAAFTASLVYFGKTKTHVNQKIINKTTAHNKPENKNIITPKFDFYTILPQRKNSKNISEYELEITAVKDYAAADHLKAELALLGFTASIIPIHSENGQKYSVSVGPYDNKDGATADLERLKQNKISGKLKKVH